MNLTIDLTIDLIIKSLILKTSSFIIVLIEMTVKLNEAFIKNSIDFISFIIILSIFSSESDIKFLLNETLDEIMISFFF